MNRKEMLKVMALLANISPLESIIEKTEDALKEFKNNPDDPTAISTMGFHIALLTMAMDKKENSLDKTLKTIDETDELMKLADRMKGN